MRLRVAGISHCPVKGLAVRQLDECELTEAGITGDREFFLVDEDDRLVDSKGLGVLQQIIPRHDREAHVLTLAFPDGTTVSEEVGFNGSLGARFWRETVEVRVVDGPWSEAISDFAGRDLRLVRDPGVKSCIATHCGKPAWNLAPSRSQGMHRPRPVDEPAHNRHGIAALQDLTPRVPTVSEEVGFNGSLGARFWRETVEGVRLGEAVVVPQVNVGRCAVTMQNPDTGAPDLDTLKALGSYRDVIETTEPPPFGVYAAVAHPGQVRLGDPVELA